MTEASGLPGDDPVVLARHFGEQVPHTRDLGVRVISVEADQVRMCLAPQPWLLADDDTGEICTSVLYSLADSAAGLAVLAAAGDLAPIATLDLRMDYLRPAAGDRALSALARCLQLTDDVAFVHCEVLTEGHEQPVATGKATFMRNTRGQRLRVAIEEGRPHVTAPASRQSRPPEHAAGTDAAWQRLLARIPYARHLGLETRQKQTGTALHLPYREALIGNPVLPALHGGALGGLIEITARVAAQSRDTMGRRPRILDCDIDYLRSARAQSTFAGAEIVRQGRRASLVQVTCWQEGASAPIARGRVQLLFRSRA